jgi:hypothetical protein
MNNPIITASGVIPALSCVKVSATANKVEVCTTSTDTVFGVTFGADTAIGGEVVFQTSDTQLDIVTLRAGGIIAVGNQLVPDAAGAVVTAASGQFIAITAATSGTTLSAYKKKAGTGGGGGTPGGSPGQVQFNSSSAFAGDPGLTYNSGTDALTVLGDSFINGVRIGEGNNSIVGNTAVGVDSLNVLGTALRTTAVGYQAGAAINGGYDNTMVGWGAGKLLAGTPSNGSGYDNTLIGSNAGSLLVGPTANTATTNTFIGSNVGINATSSGSTMVGYIAGVNTTTGGENVFIGARAGRFNTTGNGNVAVGNDSLRGTSTAQPFKGTASTAVGASALLNVMPSFIGDSNTAVGYQAGLDIRTGGKNVAIGNQALVSNLIGDNNTSVGEYSGDGCKQSNNVYVGMLAAYRNWFGTENVIIGQNAGSGNNAITNQKDEYPNRSPSTVSPSTSPYNASQNTVIGFEAFKNPADTTFVGNPIIVGAVTSITQTVGLPIVINKVGHLLNTGDPVAFRSEDINTAAQNPLGTTIDANLSLTLVPAPLFSGRTYYVIKINDNSYQLAQTPDETGTNGFNVATPILCTATGSGTINRVTVGTTVADGNTIMGYQAGYITPGDQFSGTYNTLVGYRAGREITSGASNVCIGRLSGGILAGGGNVCVGKGAVVGSASNNFSIVIGNDAQGFGTGTTTIGDPGNTVATRLYGVIATGSAAPTALTISAGTIAPVKPIVFVSGSGTLTTITAPIGISGSGGQITIIPSTGATWVTSASGGNIALASTAVVGKALIMTYDSGTTKWYPSY